MLKQNAILGDNVPQREREVPAAITRQERVVSEIEDCVNDLLSRLAWASQKTTESKTLAAPTPQVSSELANTLECHTARLNKVVKDLRDQLSVLEL